MTEKEFTEHILPLRPKLLSAANMLYRNDPVLAEDLVQECLAQMWEHRASFDWSRGSPSAWAFTRLYSRFKDERRRVRPHEDVSDPVFESKFHVRSDASIRLSRGECMRILAKLKDTEQRIMFLVLQEVPYKEIGRLVGLSELTIRSKVSRLRSRLREIRLRLARRFPPAPPPQGPMRPLSDFEPDPGDGSGE